MHLVQYMDSYSMTKMQKAMSKSKKGIIRPKTKAKRGSLLDIQPKKGSLSDIRKDIDNAPNVPLLKLERKNGVIKEIQHDFRQGSKDATLFGRRNIEGNPFSKFEPKFNPQNNERKGEFDFLMSDDENEKMALEDFPLHKNRRKAESYEAYNNDGHNYDDQHDQDDRCIVLEDEHSNIEYNEYFQLVRVTKKSFIKILELQNMSIEKRLDEFRDLILEVKEEIVGEMRKRLLREVDEVERREAVTSSIW